MTSQRARIIAPWLSCLAAAIWIVARAHYITDLSAFLPANPTRLQRLLVDQLRDGPASRLILVALEKGDAASRARVSSAMAARLRAASAFTSVDNGEPVSAERDRDFLFRHRYLLSEAIDNEHFSAAGLKSAIEDTVQNLASSSGLLMKSLVPHDPTGELLRIIDQVSNTQGPRTQDGVWVSADGARTLLAAQTAAPGSDTDAQEQAIGVIRRAFQEGVNAAGPGAAAVELRFSGPGVFAVAARDKIERAAIRLSFISSILVVAILLAVYRSMIALGLGLLPVATGALVGIAAVALGFGAVHGITLGFGITLIGEAVDYSIYFFIQSSGRDRSDSTQSWQRRIWPTIRLGMLTSVCGFASLLPSGFPGLAQLGLYSICGLIAAGLVTRFVLPELLPSGLRLRNVEPVGIGIGRLRDGVLRCGSVFIASAAVAVAAAASLLLYTHRATLWNHELSALSPVSLNEQQYDAKLRADLGAANVLDIVVVSGPSLRCVARLGRRQRDRRFRQPGELPAEPGHAGGPAQQLARASAAARQRTGCAGRLGSQGRPGRAVPCRRRGRSARRAPDGRRLARHVARRRIRCAHSPSIAGMERPAAAACARRGGLARYRRRARRRRSECGPIGRHPGAGFEDAD
jgi:predicted exporter